MCWSSRNPNDLLGSFCQEKEEPRKDARCPAAEFHMASVSSGTGNPNEGITEIHCGEALQIGMLSELKERLLIVLDAGGPVRLVLSELERIDTASLQLLLAFVRAAGHRGVGLSRSELSRGFLDAVRCLGLGEAFGPRMFLFANEGR